jgi:hypothetical protein
MEEIVANRESVLVQFELPWALERSGVRIRTRSTSACLIAKS